jgi:hypothetical protein
VLTGGDKAKIGNNSNNQLSIIQLSDKACQEAKIRAEVKRAMADLSV